MQQAIECDHGFMYAYATMKFYASEVSVTILGMLDGFAAMTYARRCVVRFVQRHKCGA